LSGTNPQSTGTLMMTIGASKIATNMLGKICHHSKHHLLHEFQLITEGVTEVPTSISCECPNGRLNES
jgi:hypothetical protein